MHTADEQAWVERILPDYDNLRAAFEHVMATGMTSTRASAGDVASGVRTSAHRIRGVRVGRNEHSRPPIPRIRCSPPRLASPRGAHGTAVITARARTLASLAGDRLPGRGNGRVAYPGDVLADVALYEGDPATALAHYEREMKRARRDEDPPGWCGRCSTSRSASGRAALPQRRAWRSGGGRAGRRRHGQPDGPIDGRYALGLVLKKSEPDSALALFDEAAESAASVAELLVARHRADGSGRNAACTRRPGKSGK